MIKECCENCLYKRWHKESGKWEIYCAKHDEETTKDNVCLSWTEED